MYFDQQPVLSRLGHLGHFKKYPKFLIPSTLAKCCNPLQNIANYGQIRSKSFLKRKSFSEKNQNYKRQISSLFLLDLEPTVFYSSSRSEFSLKLFWQAIRQSASRVLMLDNARQWSANVWNVKHCTFKTECLKLNVRNWTSDIVRFKRAEHCAPLADNVLVCTSWPTMVVWVISLRNLKAWYKFQVLRRPGTARPKDLFYKFGPNELNG